MSPTKGTVYLNCCLQCTSRKELIGPCHRMNQTMEKLSKMEKSNYTTLIRVLFGLEWPTPLPDDPTELPNESKNVSFIDPTLNDSQQNAIRFALASREVALIHGPPGTGKTYTLIELILQLVHLNQQVLVCGPSNISVDNIVERLAPHKLPIVRLGHPARLLPSVLNHSLDVLTQTSDAASIVKDVRKEMDAKQASIKKTRSGKERRAVYGEIKELRKEYREREKQCVTTLVRGSKVVLATLHGAGGFRLRSEDFDTVIIDEGSQALEAQCWVPLLPAKKLVLAGDHLQLPPTIKSSPHPDHKPKLSTASTLSTTLFDRLLTLHGDCIKRMLTTQYRMHASICAFPSATMYSSLLQSDPSVSSRLLCHLPSVSRTADTSEPLIFYDTQGGEFPESPPEDSKLLLSESHSNPHESLLCLAHVKSLVSAGLAPDAIAVITPYSAQLSLLASLLKPCFPNVELGTVDGFQGREKEAVVLSLVRSNEKGEVGFLGEERRLNVAMTRARRGLVVVGDGECVGRGSDFLRKWMQHLEEHADLRYPDVGELLREHG
ncbi:MAG: hypothetical protein Q9167_003368 [Letrouitia subvulpina]